MEVIPQTSTLGAQIRGIDLSQPLSDSVLADVNQAFLDYQVIYFPGQQLTHQQYNDFARRFGPLRDYMFADGIDGYPYITEIVKTETETESFGGFWHSDSSYLKLPPKITMLYARQVPPKGGDTLFSNMYAVYQDLSAGMKAALDPLKAVNSASVVPRNEDVYEAVKSKNSDQYTQQAVHPVIRNHDESGRKSIFVNHIHTLEIEGMSREESLPILNYLYERVQKPEYSFRLHWEVDTLTMWDNRCTQHYALNDYHGHRRVMHRIIVEGELPR